MEQWIAYFSDIPPQHRAGIFVVGMVFFWVLEGLIPLIPNSFRKVRHDALNLFLTLLNFAVAFIFAGILLKASLFTSETQFGLLYLVSIPLWLQVILGLVLLDFFGAYLAHWTLHKVKWMWKFHVVHHSDQHVDATSGFRHHPGEIILRMVFTVGGVLIIGLPMGVIMLYQTLSLIFAQITHANINLPNWLDIPLSFIFITPNMHKVHHHYQQPFTDSNYGNIFAIWDRALGTFMHLDKHAIVYGLDTHMDQQEVQNLGNLLEIPFQQYREPEGLQKKKI